jgi:hypothetical protein
LAPTRLNGALGAVAAAAAVPWSPNPPSYHELIVRRPYPGASEVLVKGSFDDWKQSIKLEKTGEGFEKSVELALDKRILYKV